MPVSAATAQPARRPATAGVGTSTNPEAGVAGREAAEAALAQLDGPADLVLVFATTGYPQDELLAAIVEVVGPQAQVSGCSGEGVISQAGSDEDPRAVNVMAITAGRLTFELASFEGYAADPAGCGVALAAKVRALGPERARAVLVFPDGMQGNCTAFLGALDAHLPHPIPVAGGTAGDVLRYDAGHVMVTRQYHGARVLTDSVSAVIIGGDVEVDVEVSHGCTAIGLVREVTRSTPDGFVHEIDGISAWSAFKEYLDDDPEDLFSADIVHLCVGVRLPDEAARDYDSSYLIRTPITRDKEAGALFFPGGLEVGTKIQFTRREPELVGTSARRSAERLAQRHPGRSPLAMFQFDCAGRGRILFGERTDAIATTPMQTAVGRGVPWIGFHTFGEIAPIAGTTYFHNYTVVLCALYEGTGGEA